MYSASKFHSKKQLVYFASKFHSIYGSVFSNFKKRLPTFAPVRSWSRLFHVWICAVGFFFMSLLLSLVLGVFFILYFCCFAAAVFVLSVCLFVFCCVFLFYFFLLLFFVLFCFVLFVLFCLFVCFLSFLVVVFVCLVVCLFLFVCLFVVSST